MIKYVKRTKLYVFRIQNQILRNSYTLTLFCKTTLKGHKMALDFNCFIKKCRSGPTCLKTLKIMIRQRPSTLNHVLNNFYGRNFFGKTLKNMFCRPSNSLISSIMPMFEYLKNIFLSILAKYCLL